MASAVIANMYLTPLDQRISAYNEENSQGKSSGNGVFASLLPDHLSVRWMDDIWVFGTDEGLLRNLQVNLQKAARDYGLELNASKTGVYHGDELTELALRINHSAVDDALSGDEPNSVPLEELIDGIIAYPESVERSSIHFAMHRMRIHGLKNKLPLLQEIAPKMPHGADHLARAFRDFGVWKEMQDWYLDYLDGDWSCFEWSVAQFGTMFPTGGKVDSKLIARIESMANDRPSLPLMALALQRLCKWRPDAVKELVRNLQDRADMPLERRLLAMAALAVKDERRIISGLLTGYEENAVTRAMIEATSYQPFKVAPDFDGVVKEPSGQE